MKKLILRSTLMIATILVTMIPSIAFANTESSYVQTSSGNMKLSEQKAILRNEDGTQYLVNLYESDEQVASKEKIGNETLYMKQYVVELNSNEMTQITDSSSCRINNRPQTEWDANECVKGTLTIYYYRAGDSYLITRASGQWLIYQSGTSIEDMRYTIACNEGFEMGQYISGDSTGTFDVTTNFTKYVDIDQGMCMVGARMDCKVVRPSGHSWDFGFMNALAWNVPSPFNAE